MDMMLAVSLGFFIRFSFSQWSILYLFIQVQLIQLCLTHEEWREKQVARND